MTHPAPFARRLAALLFAAAALLAAGCASRPVIRAHAAPGADVATYGTYGFFDKLGTDDSSYSSLLSQYLKTATSREMEARGYRYAATGADLVLNFHLGEKNKLESRPGPNFGLSFGRGWGWRSGYAWGVGINDADLRTTTEGTLTIDVVDRAKNELVWAGSAVAEVTSKTLDDPRGAIDRTVPLIFAKYPGRAR